MHMSALYCIELGLHRQQVLVIGAAFPLYAYVTYITATALDSCGCYEASRC
jgi:hypothetical protein